MLNFITNLPWMKILLWGGGGLVATYAATKVIPAVVNTRPTGKDNSEDGAAIPPAQMMPMFMQSGGGLNPASAPATVLPLGGESWKPADVPLANNPDVEIAKINREVYLAQIAAQKEIANKGLSYLSPQTGSLGGQAGTPYNQLPGMGQKQFQSVDQGFSGKPPAGFAPPPASRYQKVSDTDAVAFIKEQLQSSGGIKGMGTAYRTIQQEGIKRGYTQQEINALIMKAGQ